MKDMRVNYNPEELTIIQLQFTIILRWLKNAFVLFILRTLFGSVMKMGTSKKSDGWFSKIIRDMVVRDHIASKRLAAAAGKTIKKACV